MTEGHLKIDDVEDLKAGDIICIPSLHRGEWSRLVIYEVTKRLFKTYVLLDETHAWNPGDLYSFQIIDLDPTKWRLVA